MFVRLRWATVRHPVWLDQFLSIDLYNEGLPYPFLWCVPVVKHVNENVLSWHQGGVFVTCITADLCGTCWVIRSKRWSFSNSWAGGICLWRHAWSLVHTAISVQCCLQREYSGHSDPFASPDVTSNAKLGWSTCSRRFVIMIIKRDMPRSEIEASATRLPGNAARMDQFRYRESEKVRSKEWEKRAFKWPIVECLSDESWGEMGKSKVCVACWNLSSSRRSATVSAWLKSLDICFSFVAITRSRPPRHFGLG